MGDALIDSVIAFESTLLQEIGQTESYRFRMPLRALLLLEDASDYDRDFIYQFFRELYDSRSAIVHRGSEIDGAEFEDQELNAEEFTALAREFLQQDYHWLWYNLKIGQFHTIQDSTDNMELGILRILILPYRCG